MPVNNRKPPAKMMEEALRCYELQNMGMSTYQIAEEMGFSQKTVRNRIDLAIKGRKHPKIDEYRQRQIDRCHYYLKALRKQIEAGDPKAIAQAVRTEERLARLIGLDSATAFKVEVEPSDKYTNQMTALRLLREIQEKRGADSTAIEGQMAAIEQAKAEGRPAPRPKRPVPQWYQDQEAKKAEARERARNAPRDPMAEFPGAFEVHNEPVEFSDEIETPAPAPRPRRRGKPVPNPADQFLRDTDD